MDSEQEQAEEEQSKYAQGPVRTPAETTGAAPRVTLTRRPRGKPPSYSLLKPFL